MEEEKPTVGIPEMDDDKASNNGAGSTASHSSEEYVKVNKDDASLDDAVGDIPREDVEEISPLNRESPTPGFGESLMNKIDPREGGGTETVVAESLDGEEVKPELVEVHDVPEQAAAVEDLPPNPPSEEFLEEDTTSLPVEDVICAKPEESTAPVPGAVIDLIYWRDIKKTAAVFSFLLLMLFSLMFCSVISVVAYAALAFLTVTVGFRVYRLVLQTLNGTQQPHPFQEILDLDVSLSPERIQKYATVISCHVNCWISALRDLLLVKNTLSSLKFGVFLWLLTYVGAIFNGLTLIICDVILIFTVPPIYEKYQSQIDAYFGMAKDKVGEIVKKVKAKLPGKKEKTQ